VFNLQQFGTLADSYFFVHPCGFFPALESTNGIPTPPFFPSFEIAISCAFHWASSHSVGHLYSTGSCISISAANELACLCHAPFALGAAASFWPFIAGVSCNMRHSFAFLFLALNKFPLQRSNVAYFRAATHLSVF